MYVLGSVSSQPCLSKRYITDIFLLMTRNCPTFWKSRMPLNEDCYTNKYFRLLHFLLLHMYSILNQNDLHVLSSKYNNKTAAWQWKHLPRFHGQANAWLDCVAVLHNAKVMNSSSVITVCWKRIAMTLVFSIIVTARCPDSHQTKLRLCDGAASVRTSWAPQLLRFLAWLQERLLHIFV